MLWTSAAVYRVRTDVCVIKHRLRIPKLVHYSGKVKGETWGRLTVADSRLCSNSQVSVCVVASRTDIEQGMRNVRSHASSLSQLICFHQAVCKLQVLCAHISCCAQD